MTALGRPPPTGSAVVVPSGLRITRDVEMSVNPLFDGRARSGNLRSHQLRSVSTMGSTRKLPLTVVILAPWRSIVAVSALISWPVLPTGQRSVMTERKAVLLIVVFFSYLIATLGRWRSKRGVTESSLMTGGKAAAL